MRSGVAACHELAFTRDGLRVGVTAIVERSTDPQTWTPLAAAAPGGRFLPQQTGATVVEGGGAVRPVAIFPGGNFTSEFWRLRVGR